MNTPWNRNSGGEPKATRWRISDWKSQRCSLHSLTRLHSDKCGESHNAGKSIQFSETQGKIFDDQGELVAIASKAGNLYYLNCESLQTTQINSSSHQSKESLWHRRFGHLKAIYTKKGRAFDYNTSMSIAFEHCIGVKIHRNPFLQSSHERTTKPLEPVHSDVCRKMDSLSFNQAECFVTFIDKKTHYMYVRIYVHKYKMFQKFLERNPLLRSRQDEDPTDRQWRWIHIDWIQKLPKEEGILH